MNLKPLEDLHDSNTPPPQPNDARGRSAQNFVIDARVTAHGETKQAMATGVDIYAASAPIIVKACLALLDGDRKPGVRAPCEVFDARSFLAGLEPDITVEYR